MGWRDTASAPHRARRLGHLTLAYEVLHHFSCTRSRAHRSPRQQPPRDAQQIRYVAYFPRFAKLPQVVEKADRDSIPRFLPVDSSSISRCPLMLGPSARCHGVDRVCAGEDLTTGDAGPGK